VVSGPGLRSWLAVTTAAAPAARAATPMRVAWVVSAPVKASVLFDGSPPRGGAPDAAEAESIDTTVMTGTSHAAPASPAAPRSAARRVTAERLTSSPCMEWPLASMSTWRRSWLLLPALVVVVVTLVVLPGRT
jgi:hypothetical protein